MSNNHDDNTENDQDIRRLLQAAGPRQQPSAEMRDRVHAVALQEWQTAVARAEHTKSGRFSKISGRNFLALAAGAFLVSLLGLVGWQATIQNDVPALAQIDYASGAYTVADQPASKQHQVVANNTEISTAPQSRLMLSLFAGGKVYMDENTQISIQDPHTVEVFKGRIYVDSSRQDRLRIVTPTATITDIGTLFEVSLQPAGLVVALREGQLNIITPGQKLSAAASPAEGELIEISNGHASRTPLSTTDKRWQWAQTARPPMQLLDVSIYEYLVWVARDSGRTLQFESRSAELLAQSERFVSAISTDQVDVDSALEVTAHFRRVHSEPHILLVGLLD